jgi:hypothetical protein
MRVRATGRWGGGEARGRRNFRLGETQTKIRSPGVGWWLGEPAPLARGQQEGPVEKPAGVPNFCLGLPKQKLRSRSSDLPASPPPCSLAHARAMARVRTRMRMRTGAGRGGRALGFGRAGPVADEDRAALTLHDDVALDTRRTALHAQHVKQVLVPERRA